MQHNKRYRTTKKKRIANCCSIWFSGWWKRIMKQRTKCYQFYFEFTEMICWRCRPRTNVVNLPMCLYMHGSSFLEFAFRHSFWCLYGWEACYVKHIWAWIASDRCEYKTYKTNSISYKTRNVTRNSGMWMNMEPSLHCVANGATSRRRFEERGIEEKKTFHTKWLYAIEVSFADSAWLHSRYLN